MPSDKARLYVALYVRGGESKMPGKEDRYHWALLVGPKNESENTDGVRYHVKDKVTGPGKTTWVFEERQVTMAPTNMVLVRVLIGKVADSNGLAEILRTVGVVEDDTSWNCVSWVREALSTIANKTSVMGTCNLEFKSVRDVVMAYWQRKKNQHRFDELGNFDKTEIPTYDLLDRRETVP